MHPPRALLGYQTQHYKHIQMHYMAHRHAQQHYGINLKSPEWTGGQQPKRKEE